MRNSGTNAGSTTPATPNLGELWFDETNGVIKFWNGNEWLALATETFVADAITEHAG